MLTRTFSASRKILLFSFLVGLFAAIAVSGIQFLVVQKRHEQKMNAVLAGMQHWLTDYFSDIKNTAESLQPLTLNECADVASELTSRINLLEKNGSALTLASPRLSARSGGKAQLTVGGEVPVVTSSISGPSVEYKDFGIMLNIEPKLYGKDQVATKVQAEISQLDKANQVGEYPAFKTRRTENDVQLRVGETLVLSGLVTEDSQSSNEGLAWLKDLPFIGGLFRNKSFKGNRTELVIFITPRLLTDAPDSVNAEEIKRQGRMIERYRKSAGAVELID